jgi:AcrR family transcriptional regulator
LPFGVEIAHNAGEKYSLEPWNEMAPRKNQKLVRLQPEVRVAEILATARIVMAENGYENFAPLDVAARCGVSEATIYRYFPTKRDLLLRVAEAWFEDLLVDLPRTACFPDIFERLRHVIWYSLSIVRKEPVLTRYILLELRSDPAYRSSKFFDLNRRFTSAVNDVVTGAIASGVFRDDVSPILIRNMIFGCIEHQTWSYLRGQGDFSVEETADGIANVIFRGMTPGLFRDNHRVAPILAKLESDARSMQEQLSNLARSLDISDQKGPSTTEKTKKNKE